LSLFAILNYLIALECEERIKSIKLVSSSIDIVVDYSKVINAEVLQQDFSKIFPINNVYTAVQLNCFFDREQKTEFVIIGETESRQKT